ncbi:endonuclease/exonuclease/phosphatase family protein [Wenxinia saemankumensis]|uniref:Endonuclease/Exonuclease/phosphatase family protein n=1 Tax=Wenxinia saemankumensis TaxID=1447782 RepID=A0A1M6APZ8_9RHOB|nr:endonuclease/exonuclease/phosphatase family protein [Wenxinia saemankumensis]SHI38511.1 Endonuclease/Exonuclease/phosphatase family protein [Wenxinia saemankumensis]
MSGASASGAGIPAQAAPGRPIRLATWNVEWFDHLFDDRGRLRPDGPSGRDGIGRAEQGWAIARVLAALDADAVLIVEAPDISRRRNGAAALEAFAARAGIRARAVLAGPGNDTQQEILLLHDPGRLQARHAPMSGPSPPFDGNGPGLVEGRPVRWSKPPLEAALTLPDGRALRLIGVHLKSKAPIGAEDAADARRLARRNLAKQRAQAAWLRARVDEVLARGEALVVLGDFNDGPAAGATGDGPGPSSLSIVVGPPGPARLHDPSAELALAGPTIAQPATARFRLPGGRGWLSALLDYAMVSPDLAATAPTWTIWHPFDNSAAWGDPGLRQALLHASDHFPVTLDLPAAPAT